MQTSFFIPVPKCLCWEAVLFSPLPKALCHAIVRNKNSGSPIAGLLCVCRPPAVLWRVVAVVIDAIQSRIWRWVTHVGVKVLENIPSFTYRNSTGAIEPISVVFCVLAPLTHLPPYVMDRRSGFPVSKIRRILNGIATARFSSPVHDICALTVNDGSAVAQAPPNRTAAFTTSGVFNDCESGEFLSNEIANRHLRSSTTNKRCWGVWARQLTRHDQCMAVQK